jgi:hypothetical protein
MSTKLRVVTMVGLASVLTVACSGELGQDGTGGTKPTGGAPAAGGSPAGGRTEGGAATDGGQAGAQSGGTPGSGGLASGGVANDASAGSPGSGGVATGGRGIVYWPASGGMASCSGMYLCWVNGNPVCISPNSDPKNCGSCGHVCPPGYECSATNCRCPSGFTDCGGTCVDVQFDGLNCGACGVSCDAGSACFAGACVAKCPNDLVACDGGCVDLTSNGRHCGTCDVSCPPAQQCVSGSCVCPGGLTYCNGACVDTVRDWKNCRSCGNACVDTQGCGPDGCVCPGTQTLCAGKCVDTSSDNSHCGACDNVCSAPEICLSGLCGVDTSGHLDVRAGGFVMTPNSYWQGYAWTRTTGAGSTITPADYSNVTTANQLCASGSVAATADSSGSGMIGVNLYQPQGSTILGNWGTSVTTGGVHANVFNPGGSRLRVELRRPAGSTEPNWCAWLGMYGYTVTIPWSAFTLCDGSGPSYDGSQVESVVVLVPGSSAAAVSFDFCINDLGVVFS